MKAVFASLITVLFSVCALAHETGHSGSSTTTAPQYSGSRTQSTYSQDPRFAPAPGERSGSSTMRAPAASRTIHDYSKAYEMCESLNPSRQCDEVVESCLSQADVNGCLLSQAGR